MTISMKRILVGLDASARTPFVRDTASELALKMGAKLILFRSVGLPTHVDEGAITHEAESLMDSLRHEAEADLKRHATALPPGLVEKTSVHIGVPWEAICAEAKASSCDLIVIGSHGFGGLDHLLGTTAAKVVNHADRNVMVVRER